MVRVVVPTLNAAAIWPRFAAAVTACVAPHQVLAIDSQSTDGTAELARTSGFEVHSIPRAEFNHGGTRQKAAEMLPEADILIYLTQDAVLASGDSVSRLLAAFQDPNVAVAYGRQLPREEANAIEAHARVFNYPDQSNVRDIDARRTLGFKTIFVSNSFAAYRRGALMQVGGFPRDIIFGEDTVTVAKALLAGYKVAYVADACVYHSHPYRWSQEFKRYFDIGVLHRSESWLLDTFGGAGSEGTRFLVSELSYLLRENWPLLPSAMIRSMLKYTGYKLGRMENQLPACAKLRLSMNRSYWGASYCDGRRK